MRHALKWFAMVASIYAGLFTVLEAEAQTIVDVSNACTKWAASMDAPVSIKKRFCTCLITGITASAPSESDLKKLATNFGITTLQEFSKRPQGSQNLNLCFS